MKTTKTLRGGAVLLLVALTSCGRGPELDGRTFALVHLESWEAERLIAPHVFSDREGAPGTMSAAGRAITVRETPDNLAKIERVLAEYDVARPDIRLHFHLIEADGFTDSDPRIGEVEAELRKVFQSRGYRLAGEAMVSAADGSEIAVTLSGAKQEYMVQAMVLQGPDKGLRLENVELHSREGRKLRTTVNIRPGQTLVLGSSSMEGTTGTFFLTVSAETPQG